jgi:hypothetical protein
MMTLAFGKLAMPGAVLGRLSADRRGCNTGAGVANGRKVGISLDR